MAKTKSSTKTQSETKAQTAPQMPVKRPYSNPLRWNTARDRAFVEAARDNAEEGLPTIAGILSEHDAFEDFVAEGGEIDAGKLSRRGVQLRSKGVQLPEFRMGRRASPIDVDGLNELLEG